VEQAVGILGDIMTDGGYISFNLVDEGWIPCLMMDGSQQELSLADVFSRAKDIREIADPSPLVVASLHRLLLAILIRSHAPITMKDITIFWKNGGWDAKRTRKYLNDWKGRFDLFDAQHPFYQQPGLKSESTLVARLSQETATGNNPTLFDHSLDENAMPIPPSTAARRIVTAQSFAVGGGKGPAEYPTYLSHAPLVGKVMVILRGSNLSETLLLNLLPYDAGNPKEALGSSSSDGNDILAWEREAPDAPGHSRHPEGLLDYLTWQSRAILLIIDPKSANRAIKEMRFVQGSVMISELIFDPMASYRKSEEHGWLPLKIEEKKEPWRNLSALTHLTNERVVPRQFKVIADLIDLGVLDRSCRYNLEVFGLCSDKAKINLWKHARIPLPIAYLKDEDLIRSVEMAIHDAEQFYKVMRKSVWIFAASLLSPVKGNPDKKTVSAIRDSIDPSQDYWSRLEIPFHSFIDTLVITPEDDRDSILSSWKKTTCAEESKRAFEHAISGQDATARELRAGVKARASYYREICSIFSE